ncbi:hypothetical protein [Burkholderia stagnalis]|uniref:hypothetical protein n=2 Tax=Burkholderia stagnalis TaxID=1503054 RepID=UPI001625ED41|nr:hypothetical protein [Burkholderia stagnalis]
MAASEGGDEIGVMDIGWLADASDVEADYRRRRMAREHKSASRRDGRLPAIENSGLTEAEYALR